MKTLKSLHGVVAVITILLLSSPSYPSSTLRSRFESARSIQDSASMLKLVPELEKEVSAGRAGARVLLAEVYLELGSWGESRDRRSFLERAASIAREVIKGEPNNGLAYYIAAVATSRLIEHHINPFTKLDLLNQFDQLMPKAIELIQDELYKGFALMGMALRYTNPPWPLNDLRKAETYFREAEKYLSGYSGFYLNFGVFYMKTGNRNKAREMFEKAISTPEHPLFKKAHEESVIKSREFLRELGVRG